MTNNQDAQRNACASFGIRHSEFGILPVMLFAISLLAMVPPASAETDLSDPDTAVEAGRDALDSQSWTNWYDKQQQAYKPINLPRPRRTASNWNWSWPTWFASLGDVLVFLMWLAVAAIAVWIIVALLRAWMRNEQREINSASTEEDAGQRISRVEDLPVAIDKPVANLLAEARRLAALGDRSAAIVYLFSHQLVEADHAGALRLRKGKTNRQYLRELHRNRPTQRELAPLLEATILAFERAFFGARPPSASEFDACLAGAERFDELLRTMPQEEAA